MGPTLGRATGGTALPTARLSSCSAAGAPLSVRYGITGSPVRTWYGDAIKLGSLEVILPAPSYGAINAFPALNADQALPATSSPSVTSQTLKGLLGELDNNNAW